MTDVMVRGHGGRTARPGGRHAVRRPRVDVLRLALWTGLLVLVIRVLHATGGALRVPTDSWESLGGWLGTATPVELAGGSLRLAALGAAWYLLLTTAVAVVGHRTELRGLGRAAARISPALVRRIAVRGGGAGLALGTVIGSALPTDVPPSSPAAATLVPPSGSTAGSRAVTMTLLPDGAGLVAPGGEGAGVEATDPAVTMTLLPAPPPPAGVADGTATMSREPSGSGISGQARMTRLSDPVAPPGGPPAPRATTTGEASAGTTTDDTPAGPAVGAGATRRRQAEPAQLDKTWRVAPGESFWSIAAEVLTEAHGGHIPADRDIARYWRVLITANHDRLVVGGDPDILLPGQELLVPAPTSPPAAR
jgi:resuscitation-promoting factor RpfA